MPMESYDKMQRGERFPSQCPQKRPKFLFPLGDGRGGLLTKDVFAAASDEKAQFVDHTGYVNLFPLLLKLLPPDSPRLASIIDLISDPSKGLWTDFGIRSIAAGDKMYMRKNSADDEPYWRGPIWININ